MTEVAGGQHESAPSGAPHATRTPSLRRRLAIAAGLATVLAVGTAGWLALDLPNDVLTGHPAGSIALFAVLAAAVVVILVDLVAKPLAEATSALERQNAKLAESYHHVFALRARLAGAEQVAAVGQATADIAHQIGTPLSLISGYVQMLEEDVGSDSPLAPRLAIIEEQAARVAATVRAMLDRTRRMGPKSRTSVRAILAPIVEVMEPNLDRAGVRLEQEMPTMVTEILADITSLELAVLNLVSNAVDAMPDGGVLTVRESSPEPDVVRLEIVDSGHGIPDELLPRIFDAWVSTKEPGRGTGLGLAITREVVQAHGGTIAVTSGVGRGTTCTIDLPAAERAQPSELYRP